MHLNLAQHLETLLLDLYEDQYETLRAFVLFLLQQKERQDLELENRRQEIKRGESLSHDEIWS